MPLKYAPLIAINVKPALDSDKGLALQQGNNEWAMGSEETTYARI